MRFAFSRQPGDVVEHERRAVLDHGHLVLEGPAGPDPAPHRHPGLVPDMTEGELTGLLEDGAWLGSIWTGEWSTGGGGTYPVMEPATGQTLGEVGRATPGDVHDAAGRAVVAQRDCAARPFAERAAVLRRAGDLLTEHGEEMKQWLARESGAILPFGDFQVHTSAQECYEASALPSHPYGELLRSGSPRLSFARRLPVGVVGVIAPFNVPTILAIRAVAPALALGNAVILKPDPRTAVCGGAMFARVFQEAGLPAGLLQVLPGGADVGEALVVEPAVRVIAFTGSTGAGRAVGALAGQHLKRAHLELGGNSALVVLPDVDVTAAASVGAWGTFAHSGQICMATSRHLVHASIAEEYTAVLTGKVATLPVGDPFREQVALGPLIDAGQRDRVHDLVTAALRPGRPSRPAAPSRACATGRRCWATSRWTRPRTRRRSSGRSRRSLRSGPSTRSSSWPAAPSTACRWGSSPATCTPGCSWQSGSRPGWCTSTTRP